jgi:TonB family protein
MEHGISEYFKERARSGQRVSALTFGLGLVVLALIWWVTSPYAPPFLKRIPTARFGYEGDTQYVRRIFLKTEGMSNAPKAGPSAVALAGSKRGGALTKRTRRATTPETRPELPDHGDALENRVALAMARVANVPLVQSEDLVIEELVRPAYPEEAREKGIEGRIAVLALVDTLGRITEVEVVSGNDLSILALASTEAVWKCRFRPYEVDGRVQEVYAMFRFNFRIY